MYPAVLCGTLWSPFAVAFCNFNAGGESTYLPKCLSNIPVLWTKIQIPVDLRIYWCPHDLPPPTRALYSVQKRTFKRKIHQVH